MADESQSKRSREESSVSERTSKRPCYDQGTIISVLVGPKEHKFAVHKDVICKRSDFFRAACSSRWLEGRQQVLKLPEVKADVFKVYVDWAYTGILAVEDAQTPTPEATREHSSRGIIDVYLLGDVLGDVKIRNQAMQGLNIHVSEQRKSSAGTICYIFNNTPANSNLRKWAVDITILRSVRNRFAETAEFYPTDFLSQMATKLLHQIPATPRKNLKEALSRPDYFEPEIEEGAPEPKT